jgi:hypothetical protein
MKKGYIFLSFLVIMRRSCAYSQKRRIGHGSRRFHIFLVDHRLSLSFSFSKRLNEQFTGISSFRSMLDSLKVISILTIA